jgi:hypothetical protein
MFRTIQIASLSTSRITAEIRLALRRGLDSDRIADFLAAVDWSSVARASERVRLRLGRLEQWATAYAEGELTRAQYMARLASMLPPKERSARLLMAPGAITVFQFPADLVVSSALPAAQLPQFSPESAERLVGL